jgi:hypothetical protein
VEEHRDLSRSRVMGEGTISLVMKTSLLLESVVGNMQGLKHESPRRLQRVWCGGWCWNGCDTTGSDCQRPVQTGFLGKEGFGQ